VSRGRAAALPAGMAVVALVIAACVELSGPQDELSSVSPITVAWPSVVEGDILRDIAGVQTPLHLDVYDGDGNVVSDASVSFVVLDQGVSVDAQGYVRGLTKGSTPVRIVAQARRGDDVIQTPEVSVYVVPRPDGIEPTRDTTYDAVNVPATDPDPIDLDPLTVRVISRASGSTEGVRAWLVRYEILREPPGVNGSRTVRFKDGDLDATVVVDTTDSEGLASKTLVLQRLALESGSHSVRVLVTVGNVRPSRIPTMFVITIPINVP
jgi:hypothetical protein